MELYKYRSLENIDFLLDIIVNSRLYAATYESLNDPMEGYFRYKSSIIGHDLLQQIRSMKKETRILSLAQTPDDMLMWSYYANGHKGAVLKVAIKESHDAYVIKPVKYKKSGALIHETLDAEDAVARLLTTKYERWENEEEVRVLTPNKFVKVKVIEMIFGNNVSEEKIDIVTKIAKKFGISKFRTITRQDLKEFT
jgi:hypothetical protein